jgi:hypothetical protein
MGKKKIITAVIGTSIISILLGTVTYNGVKGIKNFLDDKNAEQNDFLKDIENNDNTNQNTDVIDDDINNFPQEVPTNTKFEGENAYVYINKYNPKAFATPKISFTKNGDISENELNSTKVNITGNFIETSIRYIVSAQNSVAPNIYSSGWNKYVANADITLSNLQGKQYIWILVLGTDGKIYTSCSNYFEMSIKAISPEISFTKNGDIVQNSLNWTKINVTGSYVESSIKYIVSAQNSVVPNIYLNNWNTYTAGSDITLSNLQGRQYIWAIVLGTDGQIYTSCSNYFEMLASYTVPVISFTKNGDSVENILNSTKLTMAGDYTPGSIKYVIDTQNTVAPDLSLGTWNAYTAGSDISLSNLHGKQYIWVQVQGKDGVTYTSCSNYFEMLVSYTIPVISFTKNGDSVENILNSTKLNITDHYATNSVKYIIDTQNIVAPNLSLVTWNAYTAGSDISLTGLQGKQYIWVVVQGKDGVTYTSCSNYFEMLVSYTVPVISFTKNGDSVENILNSTKLNITDHYTTNSVKYIIDTQNIVAPDLSLVTWNAYTAGSDISLTGLQGKQYIWVVVQGKDGVTYTSCSNYFEMLVSYTVPVISFTKNGDSVENILNSTKLNVTDHYIANTIKYMIDTQNTVAPDLNLVSWNTYVSNTDISLSNLQGKQYIWVQVQGRDGVTYTSCSNFFEMLINWPTVNPLIVGLRRPSAAAQFVYDVFLDDFIYSGYKIKFDIEISTPDLKLVEYAFSMDGIKPSNYTALTALEYNKNLSTTQIISYQKIFAMNEINADKTGRIWFRVTDVHDQVTEMSVQTYVFSTIQFN